MRFGAALFTLGALAGCPVDGSECNVDNECESTQVCARDHACVEPEEVRATRTTWSFGPGMPATVASCNDLQMQIIFANPDFEEDKLGFVPVPCFTALFSVDKLPRRFTRVRLNIDGGDDDGFRLGSAEFDAEGLSDITLTLPE
jgi:hypothetical protein